jgi:hypothetical protein
MSILKQQNLELLKRLFSPRLVPQVVLVGVFCHGIALNKQTLQTRNNKLDHSDKNSHRAAKLVRIDQ